MPSHSYFPASGLADQLLHPSSQAMVTDSTPSKGILAVSYLSSTVAPTSITFLTNYHESNISHYLLTPLLSAT
nr:hypothetical transcript [Hymenolepis microstoma]